VGAEPEGEVSVAMKRAGGTLAGAPAAHNGNSWVTAKNERSRSGSSR
jgi:hypothetical protein